MRVASAKDRNAVSSEQVFHFNDKSLFISSLLKNMNLVKTAQLNIPDILSYLNYKNLTDEVRHNREQRQTCLSY